MSKNKAVFLDRDGTIVYHTSNFLIKPTQLRLLPGVSDAIKKINELGYLVILITNQPVISRGLITEKGMKHLQDVLVRRLMARGAKVDGVYFCPHHPDSKMKRYGIACKCRKPEPGMIVKAMKDFNIDSKKSFMIGDAVVDVVSGKRAGVRTIKVKTGPGHKRLDKFYKNIRPNFIAKDLLSAVSFLKRF